MISSGGADLASPCKLYCFILCLCLKLVTHPSEPLKSSTPSNSAGLLLFSTITSPVITFLAKSAWLIHKINALSISGYLGDLVFCLLTSEEPTANHFSLSFTIIQTVLSAIPNLLPSSLYVNDG